MGGFCDHPLRRSWVPRQSLFCAPHERIRVRMRDDEVPVPGDFTEGGQVLHKVMKRMPCSKHPRRSCTSKGRRYFDSDAELVCASLTPELATKKVPWAFAIGESLMEPGEVFFLFPSWEPVSPSAFSADVLSRFLDLAQLHCFSGFTTHEEVGPEVGSFFIGF